MVHITVKWELGKTGKLQVRLYFALSFLHFYWCGGPVWPVAIPALCCAMPMLVLGADWYGDITEA